MLYAGPQKTTEDHWTTEHIDHRQMNLFGQITQYSRIRYRISLPGWPQNERSTEYYIKSLCPCFAVPVAFIHNTIAQWTTIGNLSNNPRSDNDLIISEKTSEISPPSLNHRSSPQWHSRNPQRPDCVCCPSSPRVHECRGSSLLRAIVSTKLLVIKPS